MWNEPQGTLPFSDDARQLLADARDESERLRHEYIGTEHLLLALAGRTGGPDAAPLALLGLDGEKVRQTTLTAVRAGRGNVLSPGAERPFTSRTQSVFALAGKAARDHGQAQVSTIHLFLALVQERKGIAAEILAQLGLTVEGADTFVRQVTADGGPAGP